MRARHIVRLPHKAGVNTVKTKPDTRQVTQTLELKRARAEQRQMDEALAKNDKKFRLICETATDAVVLLDDGNRIRYANPTIRDLFGYASDEVEDKHIAILQPVRLREQHQ